MHEIEMHEVSEEFARCWQTAGQHLQTHIQGPLRSWLKANLIPPFLEHLSFRLGNQLFFLRIEDVDGQLQVPGSRKGLWTIAEGCKGYACLMPMRRRAGCWLADEAGWGLLDAETGRSIDPITLVSEECIEMTDWELQDFAVQIVRDELQKSGRKLMSWHGNPAVDPSIWFVGDDGPEWIVVRAARYPQRMANSPKNSEKITENCAHIGKVGHFASVIVANAKDAFDPTGVVPATPLWRGHALTVSFEGLVARPVGRAGSLDWAE